jgi:hypothetical protein
MFAVEQHHWLTVILRQAGERSPQQRRFLAPHRLSCGIIFGRCPVRDDLQRRRSTAVPEIATDGIRSQVAYDSAQPVAEFPGLAQIAKPIPGGDECLLGQIF